MATCRRNIERSAWLWLRQTRHIGTYTVRKCAYRHRELEARLDSMGGDPDGWPAGNARCPGTGQSPLWGWTMGEKWQGLGTRRCTRTHIGCACIYGACVRVDGHKIVPCYQCQEAWSVRCAVCAARTNRLPTVRVPSLQILFGDSRHGVHMLLLSPSHWLRRRAQNIQDNVVILGILGEADNQFKSNLGR